MKKILKKCAPLVLAATPFVGSANSSVRTFSSFKTTKRNVVVSETSTEASDGSFNAFTKATHTNQHDIINTTDEDILAFLANNDLLDGDDYQQSSSSGATDISQLEGGRKSFATAHYVSSYYIDCYYYCEIQQADAAILINDNIRIGNSLNGSINEIGGLFQPFYKNNEGEWRQLTSSYSADPENETPPYSDGNPLFFAFGIDGDGTNNWNLNGTIFDSMLGQYHNETVYRLEMTSVNTNGFTVTDGNEGYGTIIMTGNMIIDTKTLAVKLTYELTPDTNFIKITTKLTNISGEEINNVRAWFGAHNDWVYPTDTPTETKGNLVDGAFVSIASADEQASVIKIESDNAGVFLYTPFALANASIADASDDPINDENVLLNMIQQDPATSSITNSGDNSYGMFFRLDDLADGASDEFTIYYAAGDIDDLVDIASELASVDNIPVIENLNGDSFTYYQGDGAVIIDKDSDLTLTDVDSTGFDGGNVTVTFNSGKYATEDLLSLSVAGTVSLAAYTAGADVSVDGTVIGTLENAIAVGNDLVINFNADASLANVQTLLRAITYNNTNLSTPSVATRSVRITVTDDNDGTSLYNNVTISMNVSLVNNNLRFGDGEVDNNLSFGSGSKGSSGSINPLGGSINPLGSLFQPFYKDNDDQWRKLTQNNEPLNFAFGIDGDGTDDWNINGTILGGQYDYALTEHTVNVSDFTVTNTVHNGDEGYGTLISTGNMSINGKTLTVKQTYELTQNANFIKITTKLTNTSGADITNVRAWFGAKEAYLYNIYPTETKGNFVDGAFVAISSEDEQASVIKIESDEAGVFLYTPFAKANASISDRNGNQGMFKYMINQDPTTSPITNNYNDSYGMFFRLADLADGASDEFTIYYAAGDIEDLDDIAIEIASIDSIPVIENLDGDSFTYYEDEGAVIIDKADALTLTDNDSTDFDGGNVTVTIDSGKNATEDLLSLSEAGTVSLAAYTAGADVSVDDTVIGTLENAIAVGNDLVINFNADASLANVQTLLRAITYNNTNSSAPSTETRTVRITVTDDNDGTSSYNDVYITVEGVNDAATITGTSTGGINEDDVTAVTGSLAVDDEDSGEALFVTQTYSLGDSGTFAISSEAVWSALLVFSNLDVQVLPEGETLTDSFTVNSIDGTGSQVVEITITGINGVATITGTSTGGINEDDVTAITGSLAVDDE
ncbi:MAG: hypothetical protein GY829_14400, partial [Gammaproteobacteria bacterium]|nr:hypothetical protein [Gammaproteobacteria bacterium]